MAVDWLKKGKRIFPVEAILCPGNRVKNHQVYNESKMNELIGEQRMRLGTKEGWYWR